MGVPATMHNPLCHNAAAELQIGIRAKCNALGTIRDRVRMVPLPHATAQSAGLLGQSARRRKATGRKA